MSGQPSLVVVGDSLLDRDVTGRVERSCPDAASAPVLDVEERLSRPGGAALAAVMSAAVGVPTTLVTPLADDADGRELRARVEAAGVRVVTLEHEGGTRVKTRLRAGDRTIARMDTGGSGRPLGRVPAEAAVLIEDAAGVLVSCYGGGTSAHPGLRAVLGRRLAAGHPLVWDPHPRGAEPVPGCTLLTPNLPEAAARTGLLDASAGALAARLRGDWSALAVAVTAGADGAWLATEHGERHVPCASPADGDTCGAGDRFASAAAAALAEGRDVGEATKAAVRSASAFVAAGGVCAMPELIDGRPHETATTNGATRTPELTVGRPHETATTNGATRIPKLIDGRSHETPTTNGATRTPGLTDDRSHETATTNGATRTPQLTDGRPRETITSNGATRTPRLTDGGPHETVVATGGCFDVLHAGHVQLLEQARRLGDRLVVLVNSDASVTRLKGPSRPVHPVEDRVRVLRALGCVDAVLVFDEDDPREALRRIRPQIWVKGGDYDGTRLPEGDLVRSWGGRVVTLPYLSGRSSTAALHALTNGGP